MKRKFIILACVLLVFAACSKKAKDPILLEVGDSKVSTSQFEIALKIASSSYDPDLIVVGENKKLLKERVIEELVMEQFLLGEAKSRLMSITPDELENEMRAIGADRLIAESDESYDTLAQRASNLLLARKVEEKLLGELVTVNDVEVEEFYNNHPAEYLRPAQCRFRQLNTQAISSAQEALSRFEKGEDFEKLVKLYSINDPYRDRGGDTGYINRNLLPPFLGRTCDSLKPGDVSDVLKSPYGYYVVMLIDRRPARKLSLDEAKESISTKLRRGKGMPILNEWLMKKKNNASIVVNQGVVDEITY